MKNKNYRGYYPISKVALKLLEIHSMKEKTEEERLKELFKEFKCLCHVTNWKLLKDFLNNNIYIRKSYECTTKLRGEKQYYVNIYVEDEDGISYEEAIKGNTYFYRLLTFIREMEGRNRNEFNNLRKKYRNHADNKFNLKNVSKCQAYLDEFIIKNNIKVDYSYRSEDKYNLIIGDKILIEEKGYEIRTYLELPM